MGALSILWSIAKSRVGIAIIAGTLAYGYGYQRGHDAADRSAEIDTLKTQIATKQADLTAARNAERIAAAQAEQLADISLQQQEYLDDLESELAARPDRAHCRVTGADAERLRRIDTGEGGGAPRPAPIPLVGDPGRSTGAAGR